MQYTARVRQVLHPGIHYIAKLQDGRPERVADLPSPDFVEIEFTQPGGACTLFRFTDGGEFCGDTWHETLAEAFAQAEYEYGLSEGDFTTVP